MELLCYFCHSFNQMCFKFYEDIAYHGVMQAITFLGNWPSFAKCITL